jgi:hypothetical protein
MALHLELCGEWLDRKVTALRAHESQTASLIAEIGDERYRRWVSVESFVDTDAVFAPRRRYAAIIS